MHTSKDLCGPFPRKLLFNIEPPVYMYMYTCLSVMYYVGPHVYVVNTCTLGCVVMTHVRLGMIAWR